MAWYRPGLFNCFQADGSLDAISDTNPEFLPHARFSDSNSSDHVDLEMFQLQAGWLSTSKSRRKDNKRSHPDNNQPRSDLGSKNWKVQEQLEQFLKNGSDDAK